MVYLFLSRGRTVLQTLDGTLLLNKRAFKMVDTFVTYYSVRRQKIVGKFKTMETAARKRPGCQIWKTTEYYANDGWVMTVIERLV